MTFLRTVGMHLIFDLVSFSAFDQWPLEKPTLCIYALTDSLYLCQSSENGLQCQDLQCYKKQIGKFWHLIVFADVTNWNNIAFYTWDNE